jgi:hypothetical protein
MQLKFRENSTDYLCFEFILQESSRHSEHLFRNPWFGKTCWIAEVIIIVEVFVNYLELPLAFSIYRARIII